MKKILVIQTAFIGDVILATAVVEQLHRNFPEASLDFLLRKGNESLFDNHPFLNEVIVWEKKRRKYRNLLKVLRSIRHRKYDLVINLQRFVTTGIVTVCSGAKQTVGFEKNPFSFLFSEKLPHVIGTNANPVHEAERNLSLIEKWTDHSFVRPRLYPAAEDFNKTNPPEKFITVSPASVWYTKQWPAEKWIDFMNRVGEDITIFLLGSRSDVPLCKKIKFNTRHSNITSLAGHLSFLESAALMQRALMNYVNDSAPLHLASAVNAPVTAVYCSTVPAFGFTPLSDVSHVVETRLALDCRPCGLHGRNDCPKGHFKCAEIEPEQLLEKLS